MEGPTQNLKSGVGAQCVFDNSGRYHEVAGWVGLGTGSIWEAVK